MQDGDTTIMAKGINNTLSSFTTFTDYGVFFTTYRPALTQLLLAFHEAKLAYLASDFSDAYNMLHWIWQVSTVPAGTPSQQMPPASEQPQWVGGVNRSTQHSSPAGRRAFASAVFGVDACSSAPRRHRVGVD